MLIKIKRSVYGHRVGKTIVPKRPGDLPFEVEAKRGKRLIGLGVAEVVEVENGAAGSGELDPIDTKTVRYDASMAKPELLAIAEAFGVEVDEKATRKDIVALIDKAKADSADGDEDVIDEDSDEDDMPSLTPAAPTD